MSERKNLYPRVKGSVRAASTANVDVAAPAATIDDISLGAGDRILLKNQDAGEENGLYRFDGEGSPLVRSRDADNNDELSAGALMYVEEGTENAGKTFILTTPGDIEIGDTSITFEEAYAVTPGGGGGGGGGDEDLLTYAGYNQEGDFLTMSLNWMIEWPATIDTMEISYATAEDVPSTITLLASLSEFEYSSGAYVSVPNFYTLVGNLSTVTSIRLQNSDGFDRLYTAPNNALPLLINPYDVYVEYESNIDQVTINARFTDIAGADEIQLTDESMNTVTLTSTDWTVTGPNLVTANAWAKMGGDDPDGSRSFTEGFIFSESTQIASVTIPYGNLTIVAPVTLNFSVGDPFGGGDYVAVIGNAIDVTGADELQFTVAGGGETVILTSSDWTVDSENGRLIITDAWSKLGGGDPSGYRSFESYEVLEADNLLFSGATNLLIQLPYF